MYNNVQVQCIIMLLQRNRQTALMLAIHAGQTEAALQLVRAGADVSLKDKVL